MTGIAWSDTKVLPYHRPIVFGCRGVVLSRYSIRSEWGALSKVSFREAEQPGRNKSMSIAQPAITPELPPVSVLPPVPLRWPDESSETMVGVVDGATAVPNLSHASWKLEGSKEE